MRTWQRRQEWVEEQWACKAAEATTKAAAQTSRQAQADKASETMPTSVSTGATMINCEMGTATRTASPRLLPVYDAKGKIADMNQVPVVPLQHQ